jgi:hypothetical protein
MAPVSRAAQRPPNGPYVLGRSDKRPMRGVGQVRAIQVRCLSDDSLLCYPGPLQG